MGKKIENHNRRICFELSRYLAKALDELLKETKIMMFVFFGIKILHIIL